MKNISYSIIGILIPLIGTSLGSAFVFVLKKQMNEKLEKLIMGFSSGVMIATSVWSLIIPSINLSEKSNIISWFPVSVGLILGILFLIIINYFTNKAEDKSMLFFSVTLHNIPEGIAVGVCFAGFLLGNAGISLASATAFALGIAIQNIPEGTIISVPLKVQGKNKIKAFLYGVLSGIVEPIAAIISLFLLKIVVPMLPYLFSFAAGAMIYVVVEELIPETHKGKKSSCGIIGFITGFIIMMILDVSLG